jgi:hypothetical protein
MKNKFGLLKKFTASAMAAASCAAFTLMVAPVTKIAAQNNVLATINFDPKTDGFGFENFGNENHDWQKDITAEDMIRFFGVKAVCASGDSPGNCVMKAAASEWLLKELKGMDGGRCEGMAVTAVRFKFGKPFKTKDGSPASFQPGAGRVFDLKLNPAISNYVTYYALTQMFQEVSQKRVDDTPVNVVNKLVEGMKAGKETYTIGVLKYNPTTKKTYDGHAVTPLAVEDAGDKFIVKIYDNNYPGETREITVEKAGKQTWRYVTATKPGAPVAEYVGDVDTKSFDIAQNSYRDLSCFEAPFAGENAEKQCAATNASLFSKPVLISKIFSGANEFFDADTVQTPVFASAPEVAGDFSQFSLNGEGDLLVVAPDGKRLGFDPQTNMFYKEIGGAVVNPYVGGLGKIHQHYNVPTNTSGNPYKIVFSGKDLTAESTTDFTYSAPGLTVGFDRIQLDPNETLTTTISPDGETITFTSSADAETPGIYFAFDPLDGSGASYIVRVSGAEIEAGKTLTAHFDFDKHTVNFKDNDGDSDTYNVEVEKINADGTRQTIKKELKEENGEVGGNLDEWGN